MTETEMVQKLLARMAEASDDAAAIATFEAGFHALPAFVSADLLRQASRRYEACHRAQPASLLRDLARQMEPAPSRPELPPEAEAVLAHAHPPAALLGRLERLQDAQQPERAMALFEQVLAHLPPLEEYWVHFRMSQVYAALDRAEAAFLLASLALQIEPVADVSQQPARTVAAWLVRHAAWQDAAFLLARWRMAHPGRPLLEPAEEALVAAHAGSLDLPATTRRRDRVLMGENLRAAVTLERYGRGLPKALAPLLQPERRPAIRLAELADAEVLVADGAVSVWSADGAPQPELSVGMSPSRVWRVLEERRRRGEPVDQRALDCAVLVGDMFPAPNLCHFLLDQATRLTLYAAAGIELATAAAIGPDLARPYQREIARRFGARRYLGTAGFGRVRVRHLAVLSNVHHLRHSAHLGAEWALSAVRAAFADLIATPAAPRRLLISRADAPGRRLGNEDEVLALLQPYGFERIVPGRLALGDQVRAFAAATHVVAPHGAALASIAFCPPDTRVLEIFHPLYGTYAYAMLAPSLRLRYAAMVGRDADSDAVEDNDPALAWLRSDASSARNIRVEPEQVRAWLHADQER